MNTFRPEFENPLPRVSKTVRALPSQKFYPHSSVRGFGGGVKRWLDVCIAVTAFVCLAPLLALIAVLVFSPNVFAIKIIDYQRRLNPNFTKRVRPETRFIILHSTESRSTR